LGLATTFDWLNPAAPLIEGFHQQGFGFIGVQILVAAFGADIIL
jgi:hypothetical protein